MADLQHLTTPTSNDSSAAEEGGCPTPLDWRQVVSEFTKVSRRHDMEFDGEQTSVWTIGDGPPLYLLGSSWGDVTLFALLTWLLREEHTCVLLDGWGRNVPFKNHAEQQLRSMSRSVLKIADSLGHETYSLHGSSFGCLVGLQMMLDAPDRIVRTSLQAGFAAKQPTLMEKIVLSVASRSSRTFADVKMANMIIRQNHRRWFPPFDTTRWEFLESQFNNTPVRQVARCARIAGRVDLRPKLEEIETPVLVIQSEGDGQVSIAAQQELARSLPNSQVEALDHCGSVPHLTHPHRLTKLLRTFRDSQNA